MAQYKPWSVLYMTWASSPSSLRCSQSFKRHRQLITWSQEELSVAPLVEAESFVCIPAASLHLFATFPLCSTMWLVLTSELLSRSHGELQGTVALTLGTYSRNSSFCVTKCFLAANFHEIENVRTRIIFVFMQKRGLSISTSFYSAVHFIMLHYCVCWKHVLSLVCGFRRLQARVWYGWTFCIRVRWGSS